MYNNAYKENFMNIQHTISIWQDSGDFVLSSTYFPIPCS